MEANPVLKGNKLNSDKKKKSEAGLTIFYFLFFKNTSAYLKFLMLSCF